MCAVHEGVHMEMRVHRVRYNTLRRLCRGVPLLHIPERIRESTRENNGKQIREAAFS